MSELISGMGECMAKLSKLKGDAANAGGTGLITVGARMQSTAKALCPVDTGDLRNSIKRETKRSASGVTVTVGPGVDYARFVEFGTGDGGISAWGDKGGGMSFTTGIKGHRPQPFMWPAFSQHEGEILPEVEKALAGLVK